MLVQYSHMPKRRSAPRFPAVAPIEMQTDASVLAGRTVNLSLAGALCLVEGPVESNIPVTIRLALPVTMPDTGQEETPVVEFDALVVRVESTGDRYVVALQFGALPVEAEWVIGHFLLSTFTGTSLRSLRAPESPGDFGFR